MTKEVRPVAQMLRSRHGRWALIGLGVLTLVLVLALAPLAYAKQDQFGGTGGLAEPFAPYTESEPYAPYTAGPVVREDESASTTEPYAPYTAGPVVRETKPEAESEPYAPYTAGPVVPETEPYAPYTAGPVVRDEDESPDRIRQNYKY